MVPGKDYISGVALVGYLLICFACPLRNAKLASTYVDVHIYPQQGSQVAMSLKHLTALREPAPIWHAIAIRTL